MNVQDIRDYINDRVKKEYVDSFNLKVCPPSIGLFLFDHSEYETGGDLVGYYIDENYPDLTLSIRLRFPDNFYFRTMGLAMDLVLSTPYRGVNNIHHISSTEEFNDDLDAIVNGWVAEYKKANLSATL
jgi:hypothetical protein